MKIFQMAEHRETIKDFVVAMRYFVALIEMQIVTF